MSHSIKLFRGILKPDKEFESFQEINQFKGLIPRWIIISILSGIIGTITILTALNRLVPEFEGFFSNKMTFILGSFYVVIVFIIYLFLPLAANLAVSLICWPFLLDAGFKKIFVINSYVSLIYLIGSFFNLAVFLLLHTNNLLSVFGLGIIGRQLTDNRLFFLLLNSITIFFIWGLIIQTRAFFRTSQKRKSYMITAIIITSLMYILIGMLEGTATLTP
ncbi:hypothetical protein JOD45_001959 [Scopulibacillus daqui]|uniref:Yip1-like protein n=1 Tax=Scopulibacillus daqui TaxID=1469162 RepID=A0ABS2Q0B8_9BACL|nr:YIP1 family protein [Scopulibacillus daqui]MBM7645740.1 hypothetical protein [Scopulibacillus daqui]